ncbi:hypothetical protein DXG01_012422 [Tephrocybe rancida]|nr:hypothetical protein DXG01_012422 [Tephrocybe rancida]
MDEIAQMTYNSWSLTVIDYILRYGSQTFVHYYHDNVDTLQALMTFQYFNSYGADEGADIRQKATEIVDHILGEPGVREYHVSTPLLPSESTQSRRHSEGMNNTPGITAHTTDTDAGQYSQSNTTLLLLIAVLSNQQHYRHLLDGTSLDEAQILFELCQTFLDSYEITCKTETFPLYLFIRSPISLVHEQPVNSGAFGDIYQATLHHETLCLKVLRRRAETKLFKAFAKEYILWSQLSHPNVLPFYGLYDFHRGQISLVSPWAENGSLKEFLGQESHGTPIDRTLLCLDTAMGVEYLHANGIVHGDIKSANVVIDGACRVYLVDFGLSNVDYPQIAHWTSQSLVASQGGTVRWQAPELYPDESDLEAEEIVVTNTKMSDVYAWGCLGYEIFTGRLPFHNARFSSTVVVKVMKGQVPSWPPDGDPAWLIHGLNESIWKLMERCWAFNPTARPAMAAIVSSLKSERPATFKDPRPPPQWPAGSAIRFRNSQNVGGVGPAHTLEDLRAILLRVMGLEV